MNLEGAIAKRKIDGITGVVRINPAGTYNIHLPNTDGGYLGFGYSKEALFETFDLTEVIPVPRTLEKWFKQIQISLKGIE
jgi:hypothetical protein